MKKDINSSKIINAYTTSKSWVSNETSDVVFVGLALPLGVFVMQTHNDLQAAGALTLQARNKLSYQEMMMA